MIEDQACPGRFGALEHRISGSIKGDQGSLFVFLMSWRKKGRKRITVVAVPDRRNLSRRIHHCAEEAAALLQRPLDRLRHTMAFGREKPREETVEVRDELQV